MPLATAALTLAALALLSAFAVLVTRTGRTEPPRATWLVYAASGCVIGAVLASLVVRLA